jgi:hypothetical protein
MMLLVPLTLLMRSLLDVDTRERHITMRTVNFGMALLQLIYRGADEAKTFGYSDKASAGAVVNVHRRDTLLKLLMVELAESTLIAQPGETHLGCGSSQSAECLCGKIARNAHGKLSAESVEASVAGALLNDVLCQELGVEAAQPGRVTAHHAGAVLPAADGIDWDSVWTIGKGIEAAYEIIRFSFPGREDEIFWPEDTLGA